MFCGMMLPLWIPRLTFYLWRRFCRIVRLSSERFESKDLKVVFVLGGPGSGKGTQCRKIVETFGFVYLHANDLLRAEMNSDSERGAIILDMIKEGSVVPAVVIVKLLEKAMQESDSDKFLIDGFPRNVHHCWCFESVLGIKPQFILFFDCPEEKIDSRFLGCNQGFDHQIENIRKRFQDFAQTSLPIVDYYEELGKVHKIDTTRSVGEVFSSIEPLFQRFNS